MHLGLVGLVAVLTVLIGGLSVTTVYGQAQTSTDRITIDLATQGVPLCGGEVVTFSGTINLVFHTTISPNGEIDQIISHYNYQKATAVSTSGERFAVSEVGNQIAHTDEVGMTNLSL